MENQTTTRQRNSRGQFIRKEQIQKVLDLGEKVLDSIEEIQKVNREESSPTEGGSAGVQSERVGKGGATSIVRRIFGFIGGLLGTTTTTNISQSKAPAVEGASPGRFAQPSGRGSDGVRLGESRCQENEKALFV